MTLDETIALWRKCEEARKTALEAGKSKEQAHYAAKAVWDGWAEAMLAERKVLEEAGEWAAGRDGFGAPEAQNDATRAWMDRAAADFSCWRFHGEPLAQKPPAGENGGPGNTSGAPVKSILIEGGRTNFDGFVFPGDARFDGAQFSGYTSFGGAQFSGDAWFGEAQFSGGARFEKARFSGDAGFGKAQFTSYAWFGGTQIVGDASFGMAQFSGEVRFEEARFSGNASFAKVQFSGTAGFAGTQFSGTAGFDGAQFSGDAGFAKACFSGDAGFAGAEFFGATQFQGAQFVGNAKFYGLRCFSDTKFAEVQFSGETDFEKAEFRGEETSFSHAQFSGRSEFNEAVFAGRAQFEIAQFSGPTRFKDVKFQGEALFYGVQFKSYISFKRTTFASRAVFALANFDQSANFENTRFLGPANFRAIDGQRNFAMEGSQFSFVPAFIQAHFKEAPRLDEITLMPSAEGRGFWSTLLRGSDPGAVARYRHLRRLAVEGHDQEKEREFLKREIRARRHTLDKWWDAAFWFGVGYDALSDFGGSITRPLYWGTGSVVAFAALYYAMVFSGCGATQADAFFQALYLSLKNGVLIINWDGADLPQVAKCLTAAKESSTLFALLFALAQIVQKICSAGLLFLFLLAVRNRFRIR